MGLLRGIVDHPENRRVARVRFRDGRSDRRIGLRPTRFRLAAAAPSTEENETIAGLKPTISYPGFAPQNWHQPSGLIGSTTILHEAGGVTN
jgi:hypothetical protein